MIPVAPDLQVGRSSAAFDTRTCFIIICEQMAPQLLTDFELMILLAILRAGDEAYGVVIAKEIETTAKRSVLLGAVYAALERLERNGLVASKLGEPTATRGGRAKRYYRVTPQGLRAVKDTRRALVALWSGVHKLEGSDT